MTTRKKDFARPQHLAAFVTNTENHASTLAEDKRGSYITDVCSRLVRDELRRLGWYVNKRTGELENEPLCSAGTLAAIFSQYRKIIVASGIRHHLFDKELSKFINDFSDVNSELSALLNPELSTQQLHENLIVLRQGVDRRSDYGKALAGLKLHFALYYNLQVPQIVADRNKEAQALRLDKTHNHLTEVNPNWIREEISDILEIKQPTVGQLATAVALATGRRASEIMRTGNFKVVDSETLLFSGQLKTKNRKLFEELAPYQVHCLVDTADFMKAFKKLRSRLKAEEVNFIDLTGQQVTKKVTEGDIFDIPHNKAVAQKYTSTLNDHVKALLGPDFSFKTTRAIWAEVSYCEAAAKNETRAAYRARALGHTGGDLSTQEHYDGFSCSDQVETIKVHKPEHEENGGAQLSALDKSLLEHFKAVDRSSWNSRAKAWHVIMDTLITQLEGGAGLQAVIDSYRKDVELGIQRGKEAPTFAGKMANYVRGSVLIEGKKLGAPTAQGWAAGAKLDEWAEANLA